MKQHRQGPGPYVNVDVLLRIAEPYLQTDVFWLIHNTLRKELVLVLDDSIWASLYNQISGIE